MRRSLRAAPAEPVGRRERVDVDEEVATGVREHRAFTVANADACVVLQHAERDAQLPTAGTAATFGSCEAPQLASGRARRPAMLPSSPCRSRSGAQRLPRTRAAVAPGRTGAKRRCSRRLDSAPNRDRAVEAESDLLADAPSASSRDQSIRDERVRHSDRPRTRRRRDSSRRFQPSVTVVPPLPQSTRAVCATDELKRGRPEHGCILERKTGREAGGGDVRAVRARECEAGRRRTTPRIAPRGGMRIGHSVSR